jgi:hypothetical protein
MGLIYFLFYLRPSSTVLPFKIDPNLMPTRPEGAHLTPPSPLDQVPENVWGLQQAEEIAKRLKQQREAAVPTATHAEPDSTHNDVVSETKKQALERIQRRVGQGPGLKPKSSPMLSPTGQEHANEDPQADVPKPETRQKRKKNFKKITYDLSPTKSPINIRDRLGQRLSPWSPWIPGQEPENHATWDKRAYAQHLFDELRRLNAHQEVKDPHTDELGSTDGSEDQE